MLTNGAIVKKIANKKYSVTTDVVGVVNEPAFSFIATIPTLKPQSKKAFTYKQFLKIANKIDFTLQDWASLLYISERTLQRYAKANTDFNGLQEERILLLQKLIDDGNGLFGKNLAQWLKEPSFKYNGNTPFSKLYTYDGIIDVTRYIGQLEWGVLP